MTSSILQNHQLPSKIIDIIRESKQYCFIVSPYFQPWYQLEKALELADTEEKRIVFLFRDDQQEKQEILKLAWNYSFDIFYIQNLHAKIYLNESEALICSMNLYDYSKENNFEVGYLIKNKQEIKELAQKIILNEMIKTWSTSGHSGRYSDDINDSMFNQNVKLNSQYNRTNNLGFCLRCGTKIPFKLNRPFCSSCFNEWNRYQNYSYEEENCHMCGKNESTSMNKPLCYECFIKANRTM